jgi:pimeloyl-ACP methyl ester carboxylesterase
MNTSKAATSSYVEARDGTCLYWKRWGTGEPVVFVASMGMPGQMWDYQMLALADAGFSCIALDRRGHGRSDQPPGGYEYDTFADDIHSLVEALGLENVTFVAHSMGGGEVVRYLTRHGSSRVRRIVLIAPMTPLLLQTADNPNGIPATVFEALRNGWRKDFPKWVADNTAPFFVPETSAGMIRWVSGLITQMSPQVMIACNRAMVAADFREELATIRVPSLVIHGDRDVSAPIDLTGKPTAALIPGCRLSVYQGAPHGLMYTHLERVNQEILDFLRRRDG